MTTQIVYGRRTRNASASFVSILWTTPLRSIPFAFFFWVLNNGSWEVFRLLFISSLVFGYVIRVALWAVDFFVIPRVRLTSAPGRHPWLQESALFMTASMLASYVAAITIHLFVWHSFLAGPRSWAVSGMFSLLFSFLFGGIAYARVFYQQAVERGAQVERIRGELARAELRALRAQVNPHFLFNTLNTIAALVAENPAAAEDVVTRLADVFRYALTSATHEHSRFGDELEFMRAYLSIERARLGDRLHVVEDIEPGLENVPVPSLLFQPLVENAVRYAVSPRESGGTIRLLARRVNGALQVTIEDDGPGFSPGTVPAGHGVGLESVRERLRIAGAGHAIDVQTAPATGARVTVTLPLEPRPHIQDSVPHTPEVCS